MISSDSLAGRKRSNRSARVDYVADFETTTDPDDCRVWGWGIARIDTPDDVYMDHNINQFVHVVSKSNAVVYFHNLKFDGTFILDWLFRHGYRHTQDKRVEQGQFTTLISDMGRWYSMKVVWENGNTVEFRDSLNKLPMTVKRIAQSFNMDEGKGDIDYHAYRPIGYQMTDEERDYLRRDVTIVAEAMRLTIEEGMTKLTVASDSLDEYKHLFGNKLFTRMFPVLPMAMDAEIRKAYRGGFTYADPRFSKRITGPGVVLDVNSLYPHIMYDSLLPYGTPVFQDGKVDTSDEYPLAVFSVTFTAKLKLDHIPCIQIKGSNMFTGTEYVTEVVEPTTLSVTNVDWELWNEQYDIEVHSWDGGWLFHGAHDFFREYIDKWSKVKEESTGGRRELAKLHLNSLYGRFALNPNVTSRIPVLIDNRVGYESGPDETRAPVYTAMGVFITSYARALTIRAAQDNWESFAYADTDSLHLLMDHVPEGLDVHPTRRGAWKLEYHFDAAMYIRPKAYSEYVTEDEHTKMLAKDPEASRYVNHIAGVPEGVAGPLTFDDLYDGNVLSGKLKLKNVPGGIVLVETGYTIKF
jgi:hypothetical protein